jgi:hypothetical protein
MRRDRGRDFFGALAPRFVDDCNVGAANASAMARPTPRLPPVTNAARPVKSFMRLSHIAVVMPGLVPGIHVFP